MNILAANSHLIIKSKNSLGTQAQPFNTQVQEFTGVTSTAGSGDINIVEQDSLVLAHDDATPTGQEGHALPDVTFGSSLFPGLSWTAAAPSGWLNLLADGQTTDAMSAGNGNMNLTLLGSSALLQLKSADINARAASTDIALTADDMDFNSGAMKIIGTGQLVIKAMHTVWDYELGTAAESDSGSDLAHGNSWASLCMISPPLAMVSPALLWVAVRAATS